MVAVAVTESPAESDTATGYQSTDDPDALRASGAYPVMTPEEVIAKVRELGPRASVVLHPLMGGLDPETSWESLKLIERKVLPALRG